MPNATQGVSNPEAAEEWRAGNAMEGNRREFWMITFASRPLDEYRNHRSPTDR